MVICVLKVESKQKNLNSRVLYLSVSLILSCPLENSIPAELWVTVNEGKMMANYLALSLWYAVEDFLCAKPQCFPDKRYMSHCWHLKDKIITGDYGRACQPEIISSPSVPYLAYCNYDISTSML